MGGGFGIIGARGERNMKKLFYVFLIVIVFSFVSCSDEFVSDDLTPPAFFRGTWVNENESEVYFVLTKDDVIVKTSSTAMSLDEIADELDDSVLLNAFSDDKYWVSFSYDDEDTPEYSFKFEYLFEKVGMEKIKITITDDEGSVEGFFIRQYK